MRHGFNVTYTETSGKLAQMYLNMAAEIVTLDSHDENAKNRLIVSHALGMANKLHEGLTLEDVRAAIRELGRV